MLRYVIDDNESVTEMEIFVLFLIVSDYTFIYFIKLSNKTQFFETINIKFQ